MQQQRGFTLVELVMVIVILGVIGSMAAVFMKGPIDAYFASARRAALTDVADTTLRRMTRDIHTALPNSLRTPGAQCVEFIPTKTGGRYRTTEIAAGDDTSLDFSIADTTFNMLGNNGTLLANQSITAGDRIVVYNLGIPGADAYNNDNTATVSVIANGTETTITLNPPGMQFPQPSSNNRFHVVPAAEQVVGYVCAGGNLRRYTHHTLPDPVHANCPTPLGTDPILASNVTTCTFTYNGSDLQRNALIRMTLGLTDSNGDETVTLHHEVHISNTP